MRIQKYLSEKGILSRREAEKYMLEGLIKVNGKVVKELGTKIDPLKDKVEVLESGLTSRTGPKITIVLYKPRGYVCSKSKSEGETVFDILPEKFFHLNSVGRLDKESEGLLLLSNDGVITAATTGDEHKIEKEYEVKVREEVKDRHMRIMERGMDIENDRTLPAKTESLSAHSFRITLREGKRHQIRRMCAALGLTVLELKRTRIGSVKLGDLKRGHFRVLENSEVQEIKSLAR